jgi:TatD DNase family protein
MLIDSHCHLNCLDLTVCGGSVAQALALAKDKGVGKFLCVSIDLKHYPEVLALAKKHEHVYATVGVHPNESHSWSIDAAELIQLGAPEVVIGVGETGLDYFRSQESDWNHQQHAFRAHIQAAKVLKKPLIVHMRDAAQDTLMILAQEGADSVGGVMHCFCDTWDTAKKALDLGFYISFSGIVTFKNALSLQEIAKKVPFDRILVETDSPYLAPHPFRGKANHPALVPYVAQKIALLRGLSYEDVCAKTTENFYRCFNIELIHKGRS